jgi:ribosomal protein S18 acetylase RimI-like enzyme
MAAPVNARLRWMVRADLHHVLDVERKLPDAWDAKALRHCFEDRLVKSRVATIDEAVIGHVVYGKLGDRIEVLRLAVHHLWRRRRVGSQLLDCLHGLLVPPIDRITATVREGDLVAQLFLRANGWKAVRIERRVFEGDDGYAMERAAPGVLF